MENLDFKTIFAVVKLMTDKLFSFFFSRKMAVIGFFILVSLVINIIFIFHPLKAKNWLYKIYRKPLKQTLQIANAPLIENSLDIRILKVRSKNKIYLEFLSKQADDSYLEINSVELKGSREGYFEYWGEMTSLLILDDDGDGKLDVIAPTFDKYFRPQVNLVIYNKKTKQFELKANADEPEIISSDFRNIH